MSLFFGCITVWFITLTIIHQWNRQNYDCAFFAVQLSVFTEVNKWFVFCLLVCLVFLCTDRSFFHSNFQRTGKSFLDVFKTPWQFVSFVGSVVIWGLPFIIFLETSFPFLLCLHPTYSSLEVFSLGKHSILVTKSIGLWSHLPGSKSWLSTGYVMLGRLLQLTSLCLSFQSEVWEK